MPQTTTPKRIDIWIRVSTEDQVRGESPETHERRARLYVEAKGWNIIEVYRLDAVSGKTVKVYRNFKHPFWPTINVSLRRRSVNCLLNERRRGLKIATLRRYVEPLIGENGLISRHRGRLPGRRPSAILGLVANRCRLLNQAAWNRWPGASHSSWRAGERGGARVGKPR